LCQRNLHNTKLLSNQGLFGRNLIFFKKPVDASLGVV